ncbi:opsin-3-like [Physella acuta]|uniref:opsin-3-like n=1 Tax=Physella acuta TaxID=109671 RepID=UPI0027DB7F69|nr:opsin-3-like [Physella acuta]
MTTVNTTSITSTAPALDSYVDLDYTQGVSRLDYIIVGVTLLGVTAVGTLFNGLAIAVFIRYRELRSPTNSFIAALCVCDVLMSIIGAPIPAYYALLETYIKSSALCALDAFTVYFLACTSIYLLTAISVDRYFIIVKPIASLVISQRAANLAIVLCFCAGFIWATLPLVGWNQYSLEGIGVACSVTWNRKDTNFLSFIIALFIGCFLLPLIIMGFCYARIVFAVRKVFRGTFIRNAKKHYKMECHMIKTIVVMIALFVFSWTPYAVVSFTIAFGTRPQMSRLIETIPALVAKSSCIWNPIIYVAMNSHFRSGFFSLLPFGKKISIFQASISKDEDDAGEEAKPVATGNEDGGKELKTKRSFKVRANSEKRKAPRQLSLSTVTTSLYMSNAMKKSSTTSFLSEINRSTNKIHGEPLSAASSACTLILKDDNCTGTDVTDDDFNCVGSSKNITGISPVHGNNLQVHSSVNSTRKNKKFNRSNGTTSGSDLFLAQQGAKLETQRSQSENVFGTNLDDATKESKNLQQKKSNSRSEPTIDFAKKTPETGLMSRLSYYVRGSGNKVACQVVPEMTTDLAMKRSTSHPVTVRTPGEHRRRPSLPENTIFLEQSEV